MILSRDEIGKLWWNDVNFFTNEYDSAIGLRLVKVLMQRITEVASLLHKKYEESGVMFIKNGKKSSSQIVLEALQKNPHLTKEELETATNLSRATITRALSDLREQNKITRIGSNKTGYWRSSNYLN